MIRRNRWSLGALVLCAALALAGCDVFTSPETRVQRAEGHLVAGEYRAALIELKNALKDDPQHARARLLLADAEYQMGDLAAAEADLERALEAGSPAGAVAPVHARLALALGRHEELLVSLATGELELPEPVRSIVTGRALLAARKPDEALKAFEAAMASEPASEEARVGAAEARAALGNHEQALRDLEAITAQDPQAALAWLARGRLQLQQGQPAEAERALGEALQHAAGRLTEVDQLKALAGQVEAALALGQPERAEQVLASLKQRAPGAPLVRLLDARLFVVRKDYDAAARILQGLVKDLPGVPMVQFLLGSTLLAQGNFNQADLQLAAVVRASPDNLEARKLLAETRLRMNRPEAAIEALTPALQGNLSDPQAEALMSAAQIGAGADPTAIARLERSVESNPADLTARLSLATVYLAGDRANQAVKLLRETPATGGDLRRDALLLRALAASDGAEAALAEVQRLVRDRPDDVLLLNLAAEYLLAARDLDAASRSLDHALALQPGHVPSLVNLARVKLVAGDLDAAEGALRRALSRDARNVEARLGLAEVAGRRGRPDEAKRWLEEVRETDSQAIGSRLLLARLYLADKDTTRADKVLEEILTAASGRPAVLAAVGSLLLDVSQYERALAEFRKAADLEPDRPSHWLGMARAQSALGFAPAARESVERAIAIDPASIPAVSLATLLDIKEGAHARALERSLALRKRLPKAAGAAMLEGDVRSAMGQHARAAEAYAEAARLEPQLAAVVRETQSRQRAGEKDPTAPLAAWLRDHPDDLQARSVLAVILHTSGQEDRAVSEYERVLASGRPNAVLANNLAWLYFQRGDPRAEKLARQAHELAPENGAVADTLGWILVRKGGLSEGLRLLEQAVKQAPDNPEIQLHYAEALTESGRSPEARTVLDRLLAGNPEFPRREDAEALRARIGS